MAGVVVDVAEVEPAAALEPPVGAVAAAKTLVDISLDRCQITGKHEETYLPVRARRQHVPRALAAMPSGQADVLLVILRSDQYPARRMTIRDRILAEVTPDRQTQRRFEWVLDTNLTQICLLPLIMNIRLGLG